MSPWVFLGTQGVYKGSLLRAHIRGPRNYPERVYGFLETGRVVGFVVQAWLCFVELRV